jgi:hypothetical protein
LNSVVTKDDDGTLRLPGGEHRRCGNLDRNRRAIFVPKPLARSPVDLSFAGCREDRAVLIGKRRLIGSSVVDPVVKVDPGKFPFRVSE